MVKTGPFRTKCVHRIINLLYKSVIYLLLLYNTVFLTIVSESAFMKEGGDIRDACTTIVDGFFGSLS